MAHWSDEVAREDGDGHDAGRRPAFDARQWLRGVAARSQDPFTRGITGDLAHLELLAAPYFTGADFDDDRDDVDEAGPF